MQKNILILEDDQIQSDHLCQMIKNFSKDINITLTSDITEAKKNLFEAFIFDAFFLDISLDASENNRDGLAFARLIQSISRYADTPIIFLTAFPEYIYPAVNDFHCFAYLIKPYIEKDVHQQLRSLFRSSQTLLLKTTESIHIRVPIDSLLYVESYGRYLTYVTSSSSYQSRQYTLKNLLSHLPNNFVRCHKSFIVNHLYVERFDYVNRLAYLENVENPIPLRRSFRLDSH